MNRISLSAAAALLLAVSWAALWAAPKKPVYVGVRICAGCHSAAGIGSQYGKWLHSKHSAAYAVLAKPEGLEMGKLSGLRTLPQESAICLGCHATAWHSEDWEKDETFHIEDGVQCEGCHGPGSEYASLEVMKDRQAAMKAGLRMPDQDFCVNCHIEKGTHVAVMKQPPLDVKKGWELLLHPLPSNPVPGPVSGQTPADAKGKAPKFAGVMACGKCHRGPALGNQWSVWRMSAHAGAWAVLGTAKAKEIASAKGIANPQGSAECLKCHTTTQSGARLESYSLDEGVGCEACHGAGSDYMADAIMRDKRSATAAGLQKPTREICMRCHQAHGESFDFAGAMKKIAHPTKPAPIAQCPRYKTPVRMGSTDFSLQLERMKEANLDAVIHWGDAAEGALVLNQMRKMGMSQPFFASDRSVSPEFVKTTGANAEGVICGYPWNPDHKDAKLDQFRAAFRKRYNAEPDTYAAHAYDGMNMLIWAIQVAGLNRAKIRDVLAYRTKPWPGVTHDIPFGASLDDLGEVFLAKYENGGWHYHSREDLNIPRGYVPARDRVNRATGAIDPMKPPLQK